MISPGAPVALQCPAKLNLTLRVLGRRSDGYHEIQSLVTRVGLCDELKISFTGSDVRLSSSDPATPRDESNLVLRALRAFERAAGRQIRPLAIELTKRIPPGSGLGGGSSNATAMLKLLHKLLPDANAPLPALAAELGSDVPFFLCASPALLSGRGETIVPLPVRLRGFATLLLPAIHCSTPAIYAALGLAPGQPAATDVSLPTIHQLSSLTSPDIMQQARNDLEAPAFKLFPALAALHDLAEQLAQGPVRMTGSGSALFRLYEERAAAEGFAMRVRERCGLRCEVAEILD